MTAAPRTTVRQMVRLRLDEGSPTEEAIEATVDQVIDDEDLTIALVTQVVRAEAAGLTATRSGGRPRLDDQRAQEILQTVDERMANLPPTSPLAPASKKDRSSTILVDLARMTKVEVLNLADEFEREAQKNEELAAFCRAVADRLSGSQTVNQVLSREALLKLRSRITTHSTTKVYLGQNLVAFSERTN